MPSATGRSSHFRTIQIVKPDFAPASVTQYESSRTGMRAVIVDQAGPKVNGYFTLATEIHDDSGAPHTLEHLCFMGSKSYQYKGLLDKLATRAYSTTNAWTAIDHTAYTLETAGWDGFAQILPVYLEHLIVPTLTDEGCYTEVHHIDGEGQDAGVVYSEMQGVQNNQQELMDLRIRRLMYPQGNGFRYETGGMMEQLRSLTADRIRNFHKDMYQPKNMCLVITGDVNHDDLLQILDKFEDTIIGLVPGFNAPFQRPWVDSTPTPKLKETVIETVEFPDEDESMGEIMIGFFGPSFNDNTASAALGILLAYLMGSSIAVIENTMVEKEQLCSMTYYSTDNRPDIAVWFSLSAVETERLAEVEKRLFELLKEVAAKELDMKYMLDCICRWRRQIKLRSENAADFFSTLLIEDHLFGRRDGSDLRDLKDLKELDILESWSDAQWREFLSKWLVNAPHVTVLGKPSKELSEKMTNDEKDRVKAQQENLGEEGMKKLGEKLKKAQDANNRPIPDHVLQQFPIPSTDSVHFISTTTARAGLAKKMGNLDNEYQKIIDKDDHDVALFLHFEHIPSNFVRIKLNLGTESIPVDLKPLLSLYLLNFFTSPVERSGKQVEFEDVVLELERETVGYGIDSERGNPEMIAISFATEPENYSTVIGWLKILLFNAIHDPTRLYASLTKLLADIPDEKRSASSMLYDIDSMLKYKQESSVRARSTLSKALYLRRYRKLLKDDEELALSKFAKLCEALHKAENFRVSIHADVRKLPQPVSAWDSFLEGIETGKSLLPIVARKSLLSDVARKPGTAACIVPMASCDSSYGLLTTRGPDGFEHPDVPALMVAMSYLDAVEGPLWVGVRGEGLAYGTRFERNPNLGLLGYTISRSPDTFKAFVASKEKVKQLATGEVELDKFGLEGAISEIVLRMAEEQPTMALAAGASYVNQVIRGIGKDFSHQMLSKVRDVTPNQVCKVMTDYLLPAFNPQTANLMVTCAQIMAEKLKCNFQEEGFSPEIRTLEFFEDDYGMKAPEGGDADEEDDVDERDSGEDSDEDGGENEDEGEDRVGRAA